MAESPTVETAERVVWGRALRALRLRRSKTTEAAATNYEPADYSPGDPDKGVSVQRWNQIEKGGLKFTEDQRRRLTKALGATVEELELERARILGTRPRPSASGMAERDEPAMVIPIWGRPALDGEGWKVKDAGKTEGGFDLRELLGPSIGVTHLADALMVGKAAAGAAVIFDRTSRPLEGQGCVVETKGGEMYPRLFAGSDAEHVFVTSMASGRKVAFALADIKGVYAVKFWGDH